MEPAETDAALGVRRMNVAETALALGLHRSTVLRWADRNILRHERGGRIGSRSFLPEDVESFRRVLIRKRGWKAKG